MVSSDDNSTDPGEKTTVLQREQTTLLKELEKAKEQEACLIMIRGTPQGHRFFLTQPEMILGRDPAADISIADQSISRKHAKVVRGPEGKHQITDLGSSNGTFVNDKKMTPQVPVDLSKEDMVKVGNAILKFLPAGELEIVFYGNLGSAAHQDALTKIYNRRYLLEALDAEFKRAKALHTELSVIFMDLDHFKRINDTYGHDAGDHVLKEFAAHVRGQLKPRDVFARYGGEEFVVVLSSVGAEQAMKLAEQIRVSIETYAFVYEGKRLPVTSSLGVAEIATEIESSQTLLKIADKALYDSKTNGRNRVTLGTRP